MRKRKRIVADIDAQATVETVAAWYGYDYPNTTGRYRCPACHKDTERGKSLALYDGGSRWFCFDCQRGGDPVAWVEAHVGSTRDDAMLLVARRLGIRTGDEATSKAIRETLGRETPRPADKKARLELVRGKAALDAAYDAWRIEYADAVHSYSPQWLEAWAEITAYESDAIRGLTGPRVSPRNVRDAYADALDFARARLAGIEASYRWSRGYPFRRTAHGLPSLLESHRREAARSNSLRAIAAARECWAAISGALRPGPPAHRSRPGARDLLRARLLYTGPRARPTGPNPPKRAPGRESP